MWMSKPEESIMFKIVQFVRSFFAPRTPRVIPFDQAYRTEKYDS